MKFFMILPVAILACFLALGCTDSGETNQLNVSDISGPATLNEGTAYQYNVVATSDQTITFLWAVDPVTAGTFTGGTTSTPTFTAADVNANTNATIQVTVNSGTYPTEIVDLDIVILDLG